MLTTVKAKYRNGNIYFEEEVPAEISSASVLVTFLNESENIFDEYPQLSDKEISKKLKKAEADIKTNKVYSTEQVIKTLHI